MDRSAEEKRRSGLLLAGLAGVNATRMVEEGALGPLIRQLVEGTPQASPALKFVICSPPGRP